MISNWKLQLFLYIILTEILLSLTITKTQMDNVLGVKLESSFNRQEPKKMKTFPTGYLFDSQKEEENGNLHQPTIV